jgi:hypothetical protein
MEPRRNCFLQLIKRTAARYWFVVKLVDRALSWLRSASPHTILTIGWCLFVIYAFPGQMTQDSMDQLAEARSGFYTDGHPPVMAALWSATEWIVAGPFGLLVIQSVTFLAGLYLILRRALAPRTAALCAVGIFLFPPVMTPMAVIWKDCMMAGLLLLGAALLLRRGRWGYLGLALLGLGGAMRYNAPAATLPLVVLLYEHREGMRTLGRMLWSVGAWVGITAAGFALNAALTDQPMYLWYSSQAVMDIAGTLRYVDGELPDDELRRTLAGTEILVDRDIHKALRGRAGSRGYAQLIVPPGNLWNLTVEGTTPAPEAQRDAIGRAWWEIICTHPGAFAKQRFHVFAQVLALTERPPSGAIRARRPRYIVQFTDLGLTPSFSEAQDRWTDAATWLWKETPIYRPWIYLVVAIVLLPLGRRHRDVVALLTSGGAIMGTLLLAAPSPDYRYSHWLTVCTTIAIVLLVARRFAEGLARRRAVDVALVGGPMDDAGAP